MFQCSEFTFNINQTQFKGCLSHLFFATSIKSGVVMKPFPSLSKTLKASLISSSMSASLNSLIKVGISHYCYNTNANTTTTNTNTNISIRFYSNFRLDLPLSLKFLFILITINIRRMIMKVMSTIMIIIVKFHIISRLDLALYDHNFDPSDKGK